MNDMDVWIATAEQEVFHGRAVMLIAPGCEGELAILPGHAPLLATMRPGEVRVDCHAADHTCESLDIVVRGGFLEVQPAGVVILADAIERAEEIDAAQAERAAEEARQLLTSPNKEIAVKAMLDLELAIAKLRVARKNSRQSLLKP